MSPKGLKTVAYWKYGRYPFVTRPDAALAPWRYRGAALKRAMALPWRVLRILGQSMNNAAICATALPSALSRRASAMASARRQARKGKFVQNLHVFWPFLYIQHILHTSRGRRPKYNFLGKNLNLWGILDVLDDLYLQDISFSIIWSITQCEIILEPYFKFLADLIYIL